MSPLLIVTIVFAALVVLLVLVATKLGVLRPQPAASTQPTDSFPYRRREFLSQGELAFYRELQAAVQARYAIMAKVGLGDLLIVSGSKSQSARNRVSQKHVDFLLCDPVTMCPCLVIELDDASHGRGDGPARDAFKRHALAAAGLPLLRVRAAASYQSAQIGRQIVDALGPAAAGARPEARG